ALGVRVHQAFAHRRADADPLERPERRRSVPDGLHVDDRGGAAEQQLGRAEQGGGVDGFFGMSGLERPDAAYQPVLEPQVVGQPAEQGLAEVHVRLDETGHDEAAAAIAYLGLGAGPLPPLPRPPSPPSRSSRFSRRAPSHSPAPRARHRRAAARRRRRGAGRAWAAPGAAGGGPRWRGGGGGGAGGGGAQLV